VTFWSIEKSGDRVGVRSSYGDLWYVPTPYMRLFGLADGLIDRIYAALLSDGLSGYFAMTEYPGWTTDPNLA
jgi:hypothetical protein